METPEISSANFSAVATDFFNIQPQERNGLPMIPLLLFLDPRTNSYVWYSTGSKLTDVNAVVEHRMVKLILIPVGAASLIFEERGGIVKLTDIPNFVDNRFDGEEVLNATIPYFLRDTFGYKLEHIRISDLTKN
jgi:hypothetical protein